MTDEITGFDPAIVLAQLKDFQRKTVDYVFRRLYLDDDATRRFLIADEVGLGKTLVARGLIAKAVAHLEKSVPRIDVVYICSNGDIARQNINRLNVMANDGFVLASRITLLPLRVKALKQNRINLLSLTPGTSFDLKSSLGIAEERALLFHLLRDEWSLDDAALHFFRGYAGVESFRDSVRWLPAIDDGLALEFLSLLQRARPDLLARVGEMIESFVTIGSTSEISNQLRYGQAKVIGDLRGLLAQACIQSLEPDLIILDEFQRFKTLLENNDGSNSLCGLAHQLFNYPEAKVILLSATPYKMYTMTHEADEDHHADFLRTLEFLFDDSAQVDEMRDLLRSYRRTMLRCEYDLHALQELKAKIESRLRKVMVRTERLAVTADRDGMLVSMRMDGLRLVSNDLQGYIAHARLAKALHANDVVEYWKSGPYLLNFMEDYQFNRSLQHGLDAPLQDGLPAVLDDLRPYMLSKQDIQRYAAIDPQNARLRSLLTDMIDGDLWKLLWLPPSLPYYQLSEPFATLGRISTTKRLIFSSWRFVPKVIAAVLSYEAERCMLTALDRSAENTQEERKKRTALLRFNRSDGRLTGMSLIGLVYPSVVLAKSESLDPLFYRHCAQLNGQNPYQFQTVIEEIEKKIERLFLPGLKSYQTQVAGPVDESWYWAAPILLDLRFDPEAAKQWSNHPQVASLWMQGAQHTELNLPENAEDQSESAWQDHVAEVRKLVAGGYHLGPMPADLPRILALLAVASPSIVTLRALSRIAGSVNQPEARFAAGAVGHAFLSLFNQPESMALLRSHTTLGNLKSNEYVPYWQRVLQYGAAGCLQAVMDEYVHVLRESLGLLNDRPAKLAEQIGAAISQSLRIRTVPLFADDLTSEAGPTQIVKSAFSLRSRFAMRFGNDRSENEKQQDRSEQVRMAFNSPFWPFVLATTSVGQEGLDFHQYCHAVVHWNLPSNPVDLEQREGRVHRYKGHAIRKNLAMAHGGAVGNDDATSDFWAAMFQAARDHSDSDLIPYWVFPLDQGAKIERYVLALPFSRDEQQMQDLQKSLAVYRMVFGQNRQEDLLAYLRECVDAADIKRLVNELRINLEPVA